MNNMICQQQQPTQHKTNYLFRFPMKNQWLKKEFPLNLFPSSIFYFTIVVDILTEKVKIKTFYHWSSIHFTWNEYRGHDTFYPFFTQEWRSHVFEYETNNTTSKRYIMWYPCIGNKMGFKYFLPLFDEKHKIASWSSAAKCGNFLP